MAPFDPNHPCETHYRGKLAARIITFIFTIVGIATAGYSWYISFVLFIPFGVSFIWNLANIIRRMTAYTPIHPGANVAIDLLLWLAFGAFLIYTYVVAALAL